MTYTGSYQRGDIQPTASKSGAWEVAWKIYFFLLVVLCIADPFIVPEQYSEFNALMIIAIVSSVIGFIGLFGYAWRERIFARIFWQITFFAFLATMVGIFFLPTSQHMKEVIEKMTIGQVVWTFAALLATIPAIIALFLYAFKSKDIWQQPTAAPQATKK